jgi:tetratricopeptide (TPR) repeat protein
MYCAESVLEHWEGRTPGRFDHVLRNLQRLREKWPEAPGLARQAGTDKSGAIGAASNKAVELQESEPAKTAPREQTSAITELEIKPVAPQQTGTGEADVKEEMLKDPTIEETEEDMATLKQHALPETGLGIQVTATPRKKPGSISLCMIVKDEEEFLGDCLQSVQGLVDEIIVCDTGSADNTKLIAEQHGARVYDIPWENDFAKARKQSFDRATSEWILWLDADERLTPDSHAAIKEAVRSDAENAYFLRIRNYADASGLDYFIHFLPRLFRNGEDVQIQGAIHECVVFDHLAKDGHIGALDAEIVHLGYAAKIVQDRRKVDRNIDILKRQIEQNPQDAFAHHNLGGMYRDIGLHNQAISEFKEALKYAQGNETYYPVLNLRMASSYEALAQYDEGIRHCRETLRYEPQNCEAHYILGQCMLAKGESQQAAAAFAAALACPESFSLSTVDVTTRGYKGEFGLALALMQQQRYAEALVHARRAAELNPNVGRIWNGVGFCAIESGRLEEAEQALQRAIQLTPQLTDAWLNLGCVLGMKGDPQGAEQAFKQALRLSPEHPAVMANLGLCLSEQGRLSEAEEWLLLAVASAPDKPDAYLKLAEMYRRHGRYGDAISIIEIALTHTPGIAVLWQQIGRCYEEAGSPEAAQIAYEKAQVLAGNGPGEIFAVGNRLAS